LYAFIFSPLAALAFDNLFALPACTVVLFFGLIELLCGGILIFTCTEKLLLVEKVSTSKEMEWLPDVS
jgi:hypothetical protein